MSHYMQSNGYFFTKFIFIGLEDNQIELVKGLKSELHEITQKRYWVFMKHPNELSYHIDSNSLVIDLHPGKKQVSRMVSNLGFPFCISWEFFIKNFYSIVTLQKLNFKKNICLAFLPPDYCSMIKMVLELNGYNVVEATDITHLQTILGSGVHYLVFDLDMNEAPKKDRYQIMQNIQGYCRDGMQTSVLKNFDTGSLFNDIISPVKEISNLILSPDEFYLFIRKFFYLKNIENIEKENINEPEVLNALSNHDRFIKTSKSGVSIFNDLKDSKNIYSKIQKISDNLFSRNKISQYDNEYLRYMLTIETAKIIQENCSDSQRELFTFFSPPPEYNHTLDT